MSSIMKWVDLSVWRRYGRFYIQDAERTEDRINSLFKVMQNFLVIEARYDMCRAAVEYTALSPMFDEVPDGHKPPEYEISVHELDGEVQHVSARKVE